MSNQSKIVRRIEEICMEFDARLKDVGPAIARLELAKALAEAEAANAALTAESLKLLKMVVDRNIELGYFVEHLIERRDELTRAVRTGTRTGGEGEAG